MQQLTVREGTAAYQAWVETPIPMYTKFYFFDMLNPRDLFHKHEKPILEERGPYTFRWGRSRGNPGAPSRGTLGHQLGCPE